MERHSPVDADESAEWDLGTIPQEIVANVLIVDDHPANLLALEAVLEPLPVQLVRATSGVDALTQALRAEFAVIVMDVQMPGLDGFETVARIRKRKRTREVPVIFVSAVHQDESYAIKGYSAGAVDYINKPFDPDVLRAKVSALVDVWRRGEKFRRRDAQIYDAERQDLLTRERAARAEAERQRSRLHSIFMQAPAAIAILRGPDHVYELSNPANDRLAGRKLGLGTPVREALPEAADRGLLAVLDHVYQTGQPFVGHEIPVRIDAGDGTSPRQVFLDGIYQPLRDADGRIEGVLSFAHDVTDQVLSRQRAEEANRAKDIFLSTLSHELRTPLTAILGWTRMLQTGTMSDEKRQRALETIDRNAQSQVALVEDILDLSRIVTGKLRLDIGLVVIGNVVESAVDTIRPAAEAKEVQLECVIGADTGAMLVDSNRVQQIVWNLVSNSLKFTPKGGRVTVCLRRTPFHAEIVVEDTGEGISPAFLPHVFERFRQADASVTRSHGGLGLGLSIVKHLVELHGGAIHAHSAGEGRGATFTVRIPIGPARPISRPLLATDASEGRAAPRTEHGQTLAGLRILVVDDDADTRDLLRSILETHGADVTTVGAATEALAALRDSVHDILVSDIGIPTMDGCALIREVRAMPAVERARVPAVAVTAYARAQDRMRALAAGFNNYIVKPIDEAELVVIIANLAGRFSTPPEVVVDALRPG